MELKTGFANCKHKNIYIKVVIIQWFGAPLRCALTPLFATHYFHTLQKYVVRRSVRAPRDSRPSNNFCIKVMYYPIPPKEEVK